MQQLDRLVALLRALPLLTSLAGQPLLSCAVLLFLRMGCMHIVCGHMTVGSS